MRHLIIGIWLLCCSVTSATAQVSVGIGINLPGVSIGINLPAYPDLVRVPGYPVYYAPRLESNFFFYDGMYWVYEGDNWYASSWYNGPWGLVGPQSVPLFVLRIPVRYYRSPPSYFHDWRADAPPRWGEHWGNDWERQRRGWDQWNHRSAPRPAPLPAYQRKYSGDRYPQQIDRQQALRGQNYRYQPRDAVVRQHEQQQRQAQRPPQQRQPEAPSPVQRQQQAPPAAKGTRPSDFERGSPPTRPEKAVERQVQRPTVPEQRSPARPQQQQQQQQQQQRTERAPEKREQRAPEPNQREPSRREDKPKQEPNRGQGQGQGQGNDRDHGEGRGR